MKYSLSDPDKKPTLYGNDVRMSDMYLEKDSDDYSLSEPNEEQKKHGNYNIYGSDVMLQKEEDTTEQSYYNPPSYTAPAVKRKTNSILDALIKLAIFTAVILLIVFLVDSLSSDKSDAGLSPVKEPRSGQILTGTEDYYGSELTIHADSGESCMVKLKDSSGITILSFYVRAGDSITVGVPDDYLYVYFATGDTWYGERYLFGKDTSYSMDNKVCDFTRYTWEYTLYPITDGNFEQTPIDEDEF